jgi:hypothetical protein
MRVPFSLLIIELCSYIINRQRFALKLKPQLNFLQPNQEIFKKRCKATLFKNLLVLILAHSAVIPIHESVDNTFVN